jgi:hypothetical protein
VGRREAPGGNNEQAYAVLLQNRWTIVGGLGGTTSRAFGFKLGRSKKSFVDARHFPFGHGCVLRFGGAAG